MRTKRRFKVGDYVVVKKTKSESFEGHIGLSGIITGYTNYREFIYVINFENYGKSNWADEELDYSKEHKIKRLLKKIDGTRFRKSPKR